MHQYALADELADIRAEIERLKLREAALRAAILQHKGPLPDGRWYRATIEKRHASVFDKGLLPVDIRTNPEFRRDRVATYVKCVPIALGGSRPAGSRPRNTRPASFLSGRG